MCGMAWCTLCAWLHRFARWESEGAQSAMVHVLCGADKKSKRTHSVMYPIFEYSLCERNSVLKVIAKLAQKKKTTREFSNLFLLLAHSAIWLLLLPFAVIATAIFFLSSNCTIPFVFSF